MAAVADVGRLSGNWWPGPTIVWAMPRYRLLRSRHTTASCLFVGSNSAILGVAVGVYRTDGRSYRKRSS